MDTKLTLHPKVTAATLAGALTVIVIWALSTYAHVDVPATVEAAITVLFTFVGGWLAPANAAIATPAPIPAESPAAAPEATA